MKNLTELISIKSDNDSDEIIEYLKTRFESCSEEVMIIQNKKDNKKSLLVGLNCSLRNICPIVLSGHIDTVNPDNEKYLTNPYTLTIKDEKGFGLGTIDMKSFFAIILDQIENIKQLKIPIIVSITSDEETNLNCIEQVIATFKDLNIKPIFSIIGEPTNSNFCTSANGCYEFTFEVFGKSCHSSTPENGTNSICIISKFVSYIEKIQKKYNLTSNCGIISGGDIVNRVPNYACLKFDIRSNSAKEVEKFLQDLNNKKSNLENEYNCKTNLIKNLEIPPFSDNTNLIVCEFAKEHNLSTNKFSGGCEAGYFQSYSGDAVIFGVGDLTLAHKPNEYVVLKEYKTYSNMLIQLLKFIDIKN